MDDLIRSIDPDATVAACASDDDADQVAPLPAGRRGLLAGLAAAPRRVGAAAAAPPPPSRSAWSFKDAIARIDATQKPRVGSSLRDKVNAVAAQAQQREAALGGKRPRPADPPAAAAAAEGEEEEGEEEEEEEEEEDEEDEEEEEEGADGEEADDGEGGEDDEDDSGGGEEDGEAEGEGGADEEEEEEEEEQQQQQQPSASAGAGGGGAAPAQRRAQLQGSVDVDAILAAARPNPLRQAAAPPAQDSAELAAYFSADPFAAAQAGSAAASGGAAAAKAAVAAAAAARRSAKDRLRDVPVAQRAAAAAASAAAAAAPAPAEPQTFADMALSRPLLRAVQQLGYAAPTPIQRRVCPLAMAGHDVCGSAVTGSGKTAAYLLPILERLLYRPKGPAAHATRCIVLVPTRELAAQVASMAGALAQFCAPPVRVCLVVGGLSLKAQEAELRGRPDIVVATPGRVLDHLRNSPGVHADDVDVLVLDEADRLLEMGFEAEVSEVVRLCPIGRQTMLFSATMTSKVEALARLSLRKPVRVNVDSLYDMAGRLVQEFVRIRGGGGRGEGGAEREALVLALLARSFTGGGIVVFTAHKRSAHRYAILAGFFSLNAVELHGNLTQRQRLAALEDFRTGAADILFATDLAGRGLDIPGVRVVINDDMPKDLTTYVHRVGRTARAGRGGVSVTLVSEASRGLMREVVRRAALNVRARAVPPEVAAHYRARIAALEPDVVAVLGAEREERELRLAERDLGKAENLLEHSEEIAARPPRTWFQSGAEKEAVKARVREAAAGRGEGGGAAGGGAARGRAGEEEEGEGEVAAEKRERSMSRRKKRRLAALADDKREVKNVKSLEREAERGLRDARRGSGDGGGGEQGAAAALRSEELRAAKKNVRSRLKASVGQGKLARASKKRIRDARMGLGMSAGNAEHVLKKQAQAAHGRGKAKKAARKGGKGGAHDD